MVDSAHVTASIIAKAASQAVVATAPQRRTLTADEWQALAPNSILRAIGSPSNTRGRTGTPRDGNCSLRDSGTQRSRSRDVFLVMEGTPGSDAVAVPSFTFGAKGHSVGATSSIPSPS